MNILEKIKKFKKSSKINEKRMKERSKKYNV